MAYWVCRLMGLGSASVRGLWCLPQALHLCPADILPMDSLNKAKKTVACLRSLKDENNTRKMLTQFFRGGA